MAFGYGLANSVVIKGDGGLIIVDTMDSDTPAREVAPLFINVTRKISSDTCPYINIDNI